MPPKFPRPVFFLDQNWFQSSNNLTLSNDPPPSISSVGGRFVGGFHPNLIVPRPPTFQHSASALNMPSAYHYPPNAPQSMTMQMALDDDTSLPFISPHSTPQLPLSTFQLPSRPTSKPPGPIRKSSASAPPTSTDQNDRFQCAATTQAKKRCTRIVKTGDNQDQDSPDLPRYCHQHKKENDQFQCAATTQANKRCTRIVKTGDNQDQDSPDLPRYCFQHKKKVLQNDQIQCAATTQADKRCTRIVKTGAALAQAIGDNQDQDSPDLPRYCFQHKKNVLKPSGYYSERNGEFVEFDCERNIKKLTIFCWVIPCDQVGFHNTSKRKHRQPFKLKWKNRGPRPMLRGTFTPLRFVVCRSVLGLL